MENMVAKEEVLVGASGEHTERGLGMIEDFLATPGLTELKMLKDWLSKVSNIKYRVLMRIVLGDDSIAAS